MFTGANFSPQKVLNIICIHSLAYWLFCMTKRMIEYEVLVMLG